MSERIPGSYRIGLQRFWFALVLLSGIAAAAAREDWIFDIRTGVIYDSNASNSERSSDVKSDVAWASVLTAGQGFQLSDDLRLSVFGKAEGQLWATYSGLRNVRPGLDTTLRYRFGLGKGAPWIRLGTKLAYAAFEEARRSGLEFRPALSGGFAATERLRFDAGYAYDSFDARDIVFELQGHSFSTHGTLELTSSMQIAVGYVYRHGDVNSSAVPPRPDIVAIADLRTPINTFDEPYIAYRFPASTHAASIGVSHAVSSSGAIQASYTFQHTSHDPFTYTNHIAEVAVAFSF